MIVLGAQFVDSTHGSVHPHFGTVTSHVEHAQAATQCESNVLHVSPVHLEGGIEGRRGVLHGCDGDQQALLISALLNAVPRGLNAPLTGQARERSLDLGGIERIAEEARQRRLNIARFRRAHAFHCDELWGDLRRETPRLNRRARLHPIRVACGEFLEHGGFGFRRLVSFRNYIFRLLKIQCVVGGDVHTQEHIRRQHVV